MTTTYRLWSDDARCPDAEGSRAAMYALRTRALRAATRAVYEGSSSAGIDPADLRVVRVGSREDDRLSAARHESAAAAVARRAAIEATTQAHRSEPVLPYGPPIYGARTEVLETEIGRDSAPIAHLRCGHRQYATRGGVGWHQRCRRCQPLREYVRDHAAVYDGAGRCVRGGTTAAAIAAILIEDALYGLPAETEERS